jgi:hypothetical protein
VVIQFIIVLISLHFTQEQVKISQNATYMDYMFKFDQKFSENDNHNIARAIENNQKILKANGGSFNEDELDDYLGVYEDLDEALKHDLISAELVYNDFWDDLVAAYQDKEVQSYIARIQKDDPDCFIGFQELGKKFENYRPTSK